MNVIQNGKVEKVLVEEKRWLAMANMEAPFLSSVLQLLGCPFKGDCRGLVRWSIPIADGGGEGMDRDLTRLSEACRYLGQIGGQLGQLHKGRYAPQAVSDHRISLRHP